MPRTKFSISEDQIMKFRNFEDAGTKFHIRGIKGCVLSFNVWCFMLQSNVRVVEFSIDKVNDPDVFLRENKII